MKSRSLMSLADLDADALADIVDRGVRHAKEPAPERTLAGRAVGIYFRRPSTRTRTSFWRAATLLGADVIAFGPEDLQLVTGESLADTARVLSGYLDLLVCRTNDELEELRVVASAGSLGVVNALTEGEHPTQAISDLITLREHFGDLTDRHLLYVGEGNSTAASLAHATALTPGLRLTLLSPAGYGLPAPVLDQVDQLNGTGRVSQVHSRAAVEGRVDAMYTSRWLTMGVAKADPDWQEHFQPYRLTVELVDSLRQDHVVILHDLPAIRGQDIVDEVLDGPACLAWRQSLHKMTGALAVLEWCANRY